MILIRAFLSVLMVVGCAQTLKAAPSAEQMQSLGAEAGKTIEYSPKPDYPLEARSARMTGAGIFIIVVHSGNGRVGMVRVARSTGYKILDQAAVRAFAQWRFKPGALKPLAEAAPWRNDRIAKELRKGDVPLKIPCDFTLR